MPVIRPARAEDLPAIMDIYNDAILKTTASFDMEPRSLEEQQAWFAAHDARHPVLVAEKDGAVVGWASLSNFSQRCAYADTAEVSIYMEEAFRGQGIGRKLLEAIIEEGEKANLHTIIALIAEGNAASIHLHESIGFQPIGVAREVGRKFGRLLDVHFMQLIYES